MYTIKELVRVAKKHFGVSGALVEVALSAAGTDKFTLDEAKKIVAEFASKPIDK